MTIEAGGGEGGFNTELKEGHFRLREQNIKI